MKKYYYLTCMLLCWFAYATNLYALNPAGSSGVPALDKAISDVENRTIYGIILHNSDFNFQYGIGKFNTSDPENMELLFPWDTGVSIFAGAVANGEYYGFFYQYDNLLGPMPLDFSKINLRTGEMRPIKDWSDVMLKLQDMTYDYSTQTMYAIGYDLGTYLYTIDLETGDITKGPGVKKSLATLAASYDGRLFALDLYGTLYQVDKETGDLTMVLETNQPLYTMQSMEFDHTDGSLYWCSDVYDASDPQVVNQLFKIDIDKKTCKPLGNLGEYGGAQVIALYIPYVLAGFDAPGQATDLKVVPAEKGKEEATISWKNPTLTHGGDPLSGTLSVTLERDGEVISSAISETGETMTWTDTGVKQGEHVYTVVAASEKGTGSRADVDAYVGKDIPNYVDDLQATIGESCKSVHLSWTPPTEGTHGGYYDGSKVKYKLLRYPGATVLAENFEGTSYTDESINRLASYYYGIIATNDAGSSLEFLTDNKIIAGKAMDIPYSCEFNDDNIAKNQWSVVDGNKDRVSWYINSGYNAIIFGDDVFAAEYIQDGQTNKNDADEWLISPPLNFEANKDYYVSFIVRSFGEDEFNFTFGDLNTAESQTILVPAMETIDTNEFQHHSIQLPRESLTPGVHCFGINLVTRFGMSGCFQITNVTVEEGLAVDAAVADHKAEVSVNGDKLTITGDFDTADIYNMTGMCVASVNDSDAQVNTAHWQSGVYFVKVAKADAVYTTKVIIK